MIKARQEFVEGGPVDRQDDGISRTAHAENADRAVLQRLDALHLRQRDSPEATILGHMLSLSRARAVPVLSDGVPQAPGRSLAGASDITTRSIARRWPMRPTSHRRSRPPEFRPPEIRRHCAPSRGHSQRVATGSRHHIRHRPRSRPARRRRARPRDGWKASRRRAGGRAAARHVAPRALADGERSMIIPAAYILVRRSRPGLPRSSRASSTGCRRCPRREWRR